MDVFIISCIEGYVAGKIEKVPRLYLRQGNFMNGIAFHNGGVPVNENSAHIVTHKGKTGTVKAFMGFSAPAVLGSKIGAGITDNGSAEFLLFRGGKAADRNGNRTGLHRKEDTRRFLQLFLRAASPLRGLPGTAESFP